MIVLLVILILVVIGCSNAALTTNYFSNNTTTDLLTTNTFTTDGPTSELISEELTLAPGEEFMINNPQYDATMIDDNYRVYYEIYVGSFSDSNQDGIGDLRGIINRLDYLNDGDFSSGKSLGITGLWLMPIMPSPSYHKYDTTDYKAIDSDYGTMSDFEELLIKTDERGIDVIIDLVLNHTSIDHPWFQNALSAIQSGDLDNPYLDYYTLVHESEKDEGKTYYHFYGNLYYEGNFWSGMPELNLDSMAVREEIIDIISFWLNKGVDGFRLDAVKYPYYNEHEKNITFWNWFMNEIKKVNADAYIVGEMWDTNDLIIDYYQATNQFDFGMSQREGAIGNVLRGLESVTDYVEYLVDYKNDVLAVNPNAILNPFLTNHDMNRAAGFFMVDDYMMHMAANLYILTSGTPFIYYGEEIGARGSRGTENTDANRRLIFYWGDGDTVQNPPGSTWTIDDQINGSLMDQINHPDSLYTHYKSLILLRQSNPEIARGTYTALNFSSYMHFGGFLSTYESSTVGVFHNTGYTEITIDLSQYTDYDFSIIRGYVGMSEANLNGQTLTIGPMTSVVLK